MNSREDSCISQFSFPILVLCPEHKDRIIKQTGTKIHICPPPPETDHVQNWAHLSLQLFLLLLPFCLSPILSHKLSFTHPSPLFLIYLWLLNAAKFLLSLTSHIYRINSTLQSQFYFRSHSLSPETSTQPNCSSSPLSPLKKWVLVDHSCLTLCDPVDCCPPNSSIQGILSFLFYFLTLQYCIGFAIYQYESATGIHVFPVLNPQEYWSG